MSVNKKENSIEVKVHRLEAQVKLPEYQTLGAAGFDFEATSEVVIGGGEIALVPTGLVMQIPDGYFLMITPRSSTPKKFGVSMPHSIGIIDSDYSGPTDQIFIQVQNFGSETVTINRGDRIAQGLVMPVMRANFVESDLSENQDRGGFGSTGHGGQK